MFSRLASMSPLNPPLSSHAALPFALAFAGALALFAGCSSTDEHESAADDEVYGIVSERRSELGEVESFSITPALNSLRQRILRGEELEGLAALTLVQCQRIAAENSRDYQARREALYLAALDLTLERYQFGYRIDVGGGVGVSGGDSGAEGLNADGSLTLRKVMGNGANVVLDLGANLFKSLAQGDFKELFSSIGLTITKPLLAGASKEAIFESLTRAERRVIDQSRTYERFRRTFAVDMFSRYWRVLEEVEVVKNEVTNFEQLQALRERNVALGEAGRMADIEVGEALQDELSAEVRVISAKQRLEGLLDDLKFFLGLPVEVELGLDSALFLAMNNEGISVVRVNEDAAVAIAVASRFDLATDLDNVSDAERSLRIATEDMGTRLDMTVAANGSSQVHSDGSFDSAAIDWDVGFDVNLPVDRLAERNRLRSARISLDVAKRAAFETADRIRLDLRDDLRRLKAAEDNFLIAENSVPLAERRVESATLRLEAGLIDTRPLLDARTSLLQAQNSRINALVDYKLASLELFLDMEQLDVDETGVRPRSLSIVTTQSASTDVEDVGSQETKNGAPSSQNTGEPAKEGR